MSSFIFNKQHKFVPTLPTNIIASYTYVSLTGCTVFLTHPKSNFFYNDRNLLFKNNFFFKCAEVPSKITVSFWHRLTLV
ncbi:hypothetical protein CW304_15360 [Bacillus sp. UFRGS-B20]|nr:hypothetical protein CW304_15360 [Bacillus sp. UFRGS-B20]